MAEASSAAAGGASSSAASSPVLLASPVVGVVPSVAPADGDVPVIRALSEAVVNRIAAGEVIHRPSSALKELLENSIDAQANRIAVTIRDGGLHALQIQDNGCGIRVSTTSATSGGGVARERRGRSPARAFAVARAHAVCFSCSPTRHPRPPGQASDFPILCERFTTSKLSEYSDLQSISTFGFRGEALASMTHVARVSITSMTRGSACAYQADFRDGCMVDPKTLDTVPAAKPAPGIKGTIILIEDLFHNVPIRRNALKNAHNEEYAKCLDVLCKYAVHYAGKVAFSCKKFGSNKMDLNTPLQATPTDIVRAIYGPQIAKELLPIALEMNEAQCRARDIQSAHFSVSGLLSNANFSQKKLHFILFINHRLVESSNLRRLVDTIYSKYLPRGAHPFVYLSLQLDPRILDVNVHPTKKEVHFLYEEQFLAVVEETMEGALKGANKSRVFYTQSVMGGPGASGLNAIGGAAPTSVDTSAAMARMTTLRAPAAPAAAIGDADESMDDTPAATSAASPAIASPAVPMDLDDLAPTSSAAADSPSAVAASNARPATNAPPSGSQPPRFNSAPTPAASTSASSTSPGLGRIFTPLRMPTQSAGAAAAATPASQQGQPPQRRDNSLVRTDNRQGRIDTFLTQPSQGGGAESSSGDKRKRADGDDRTAAAAAAAASSPPSRLGGTRRPKAPVIQLTSVLHLLSSVTAAGHPSLSDLFKSHTFVGYIDPTYSLVQHQTKLYLLHTARLSESFFYETVLRLFGHLPLVRFQSSLPIRRLIRLALDHPEAAKGADGAMAVGHRRTDLDAYADELTTVLLERASMLHEYFALQIECADDGQACLAGIPELLESYNPPLLLLPLFLLRLSRDTDWSQEEPCFHSVAQQLAHWYRFRADKAYLNGKATTSAGPPGTREEEKTNASASTAALSAAAAASSTCLPTLGWTTAHIFFPLLRHRSVFTPPRSASADGTVTQIASLENLYKIFERC